jgi:predicted 2-oxoglutarate/Fe(II)-dependent dioxygenase YbiX
VGSLAILHTDVCTYGTSIILLDVSSNLQGGDIILRCEKTQRIIPKKMKIGEHIFYPKGMHHGVQIVTKGYRRALVLIW